MSNLFSDDLVDANEHAIVVHPHERFGAPRTLSCLTAQHLSMTLDVSSPTRTEVAARPSFVRVARYSLRAADAVVADVRYGDKPSRLIASLATIQNTLAIAGLSELCEMMASLLQSPSLPKSR
jgi:hypothetical protein